MMAACHRQCGDCTLRDTTADYDKGPVDASVVVVFESANQTNQKQADMFATEQGELVRQCLESVGIDIEDTYFTYAVNCQIKHDEKDSVKKAAMLSCRDRLIAEIREVVPKKVICLGPIGFSALMGSERLLPITKVRGRWHTGHGVQFMGTVSPETVLKAPDFFRDFIFDLEKFAKSCGCRPPPKMTYTVAKTIKEVGTELRSMLANYEAITCDVETLGFSVVDKELMAVGFGVSNPGRNTGHALVIPHALLQKKGTWKWIQTILEGDTPTVFHNAKFDLQFLKRELLRFGFEYAPYEIDDTMLMHYVIDERPMGKFGSHALKILAEQWEDAPAYDINMGIWIADYTAAVNAGRDTKELLHTMHQYLALDCYYTSALYYRFLNYIEKEPDDFNEQCNFLYSQILIPGTMALADLEYNGILVDAPFFENLNEELRIREAKVQKTLQRLTGIKDLNPGSPKQVQKVLYEDLGLPKLKSSRKGKQVGGATSQEVLSKLKRHLRTLPDQKKAIRIIDLVLDYRKLSKTRGTYAQGVLDRISADGRLRGSFHPHGTVTGRLSSSNPNLQNIPDSSHTGLEVRNGFIAPPGKVLIEADYSQLELRIAAHLSGCPDFKQVFIEDRDVHQEVTWSLFQKEKGEATKYERYMAKCMNFGVMYQRGASSLANGPEMDYIEDSGGTRWSEKEVKEFFDKMLDAWPGFREWIDNQQTDVYKTQYVDTPLGRRRRFPFIPKPSRDKGATGRQAVNTPIQGTASDFTLWALIHINQKLPKGAQIVSTVHDSILIEVFEKDVDAVLELVKHEMEVNTPLRSDVPFKADADVALRWGEMGKYEWDQEELSLTAVDSD